MIAHNRVIRLLDYTIGIGIVYSKLYANAFAAIEYLWLCLKGRQRMIENDDIPTTPRPISDTDTDNATTIKVPSLQAVATAPAPTAHPYMSVDDLLAIQIVGDPQISPDGSLIAFTVLSSHNETNTTSSGIWIVSTRAGKTETPWQVTGSEKHNSMPRWSPDGRTLAFLSDRSGTTQIYLLPMSGGEARQLSHLPTGVTEYSWRPDGSALLAHSPWKP